MVHQLFQNNKFILPNRNKNIQVKGIFVIRLVVENTNLICIEIYFSIIIDDI